MKLVELQEQWTPYATLLPFVELERIVELPKSLFPGLIRSLIPSIGLGTDGPRIQSVYLASESLLAEVRVLPDAQSFDFVEIRRLMNYRVGLGEHTVTKADGNTVVYQTAKVELVHFPMFASKLEYAGVKRDEWLQLLLRAIPLTTLHTGNA